MTDTTNTDKSRRRLLQGVTAGGTAIGLWQWRKPVVESVILPVHAQTTGQEPDPGEIQISAVGFDSGSTEEITVIFPDA